MKFKIKNQLQSVYEKHGKYASAHEAMAILFEEIDELWLEIKQKELNFERIESEIIDCVVVLEKMYNDIVLEKNKR